MSEREPFPQAREADPYWQTDVGLCTGIFRYTRGERQFIRARVHRSDEPYRLDELDEEIVAVRQRAGTRTYLHLQPYLLWPTIRLTAGVFAGPREDEAIGEVLSSEIEGIRKQPIGKAQAWYYPADRTLVLWECFLEKVVRDAPLPADPNMRGLWLGVEHFLTARFPAAAQITTPFHDPEWPDEEYQTFLASLAYAPVAKAAWGKHIP